MFKKTLLAAAVALAALMMTSEKASAQQCYSRGYAPTYRAPAVYYGHSRSAYRPSYNPYRSSYRGGGFYSSPYRSNFGYGGFGGYGGYGYGRGYGGSSIGVGRGGISLNFGF